ncbi:hypothetical protein [Actinophytocola sp.]|uniref:hypothetical protein n=1 Tax=Actinophytocola sp. TaxID=1872138 RepID=UPI003D6AC2D3
MRASRVITSVLAVAALSCTGSPATAATADCGTTRDQWVGRYTGVYDLYEWHIVEPLEVVVTHGGTGLSVDTTTGDGPTYPDDERYTAVRDGLLHWTALNPSDWPTHYDSTTATCSGATVASYSGGIRMFHGGPGFYARGKFQLTRSA